MKDDERKNMIDMLIMTLFGTKERQEKTVRAGLLVALPLTFVIYAVLCALPNHYTYLALVFAMFIWSAIFNKMKF